MKKIILLLTVLLCSNMTFADVYCPNLNLDLNFSDSDQKKNGQVTELQKFLDSYFKIKDNTGSSLVDGYYGKKTQEYVLKFKKEVAISLVSKIGEVSRSKIAESCGIKNYSGWKTVELPEIEIMVPDDVYVDRIGPVYGPYLYSLKSKDGKLNVAVSITSLKEVLYIEDNIYDDPQVFEPYSQKWWKGERVFAKPFSAKTNIGNFPIYSGGFGDGGEGTSWYFTFIREGKISTKRDMDKNRFFSVKLSVQVGEGNTNVNYTGFNNGDLLPGILRSVKFSPIRG